MSHRPDIESALDIGRLACFFVAILAALSMVFTESAIYFIDMITFAALGWGVGRRSRVCATSAFGVYSLGVVYGVVSLRIGVSGLVLGLALSVLMFHGVRAAFANHRLKMDSPYSS